MTPEYDVNEDAAVMAYLATQYRHFGFLVPIDDDEEDNKTFNNEN